jgi:hypothetical protein
MPGVTEITLKHPVEFGGEKIEKLVLRRPTARDFRPLKSMEFPFAMMLDFAASLANLPAAALDNLDVDDVPHVLEAVGGFLGGFPGTGKT